MSPNNEQVPPQQQALNELRNEMPYGPLNEEQTEFFDDQQAEIDTARAAHFQEIGSKPVGKLVEHAGVLVPEEEVAQMRDEGQDVSVHASAGRQS